MIKQTSIGQAYGRGRCAENNIKKSEDIKRYSKGTHGGWVGVK